MGIYAQEDGRLLWDLDISLGPHLLHLPTKCELSGGFLVFLSSHSPGFEVWRRATDALSPTLRRHGRVVTSPLGSPAAAAVRTFQLEAEMSAPVTTDTKRGHFVPHAFITAELPRPLNGVLFRVKFPLFAYVGGSDIPRLVITDVTSGHTLWDVPIDTLVAGRVLGVQHPGPLLSEFFRASRTPVDLDLGPVHACLCTRAAVIIVRLPDHCLLEAPEERIRPFVDQEPHSALVLGPVDNSIDEQHSAYALSGPRTLSDPTTPRITLLPVDIVPLPSPAEQSSTGAPYLASFSCAKFSPDGKHLVAAAANGLLYLVWDFTRVERGALFSGITEHLKFSQGPPTSICWAPAQERRIAVCMARRTVFMITLNAFFHRKPRPSPGVLGTRIELPTITRDSVAHQVFYPFRAPLPGHILVVDMQMTRSAFWIAQMDPTCTARQPFVDGGVQDYSETTNHFPLSILDFTSGLDHE
ncbi:hypothetical protein C2E23DRAFT_301317 [Lenzites betulinus]|nr:hypothetical protein C2E23DRAFT_301317 [Lenzites betulinus]